MNGESMRSGSWNSDPGSNSDEEPFSAASALRFAVDKYSEDGGYCFSFLGIIEAACLLSAGVLSFNCVLSAQLLFGQFSLQSEPAPPESYFVAFVVIYLLVRACAQVVINKWLLALQDGQPMSFDELLGFDFGYHLPVTVRLTAASLVFNFCTLVGSVLLFGPGLFLASTLRFYKFIIVDRDADAVQGLQESFELSGPHKKQLIKLSAITAGFKLLGLCLFGIGFVPACAISGLAEAYAYKQLLQEYDQEPDRQRSTLN
jgi:uncharacterized membrane protein